MLILAQVKAKARGKEKPRRHKWKGCTANAERTYWQISPTAQGDPICFAFNSSSGCSEKGVTAGQRCRRGWHVCCEPKCQLPHSLQEHPK